MPSYTKGFSLRAARWQSAQILKGLGPADMALPQPVKARRKEFLWNAMLTELDARNLANYLSLDDKSFSPEYHAFKRAWQRDEWNHYLGFRRIYSLTYGQAEENIAHSVEADTGNFAHLRRFLADEFSVCLVLAYDEIATFKSYLAEFPFYQRFGDSRVFSWFRRVTRDELNHFLNCVEIIKFVHGQNVPRIGAQVNSLIEWDLKRRRYKRTFVFDHYWYSEEFLDHCKSIIENYFVDGLIGVNLQTRIEMNNSATFEKKYRYI